MADMHPSDTDSLHELAIGRVGEDYLKAIWSALEWGGDPITVSELAERSDATRSTVSINLKRLAAMGLLTHDRYRPILLTQQGQQLAKQMVRRHRLWETFLVEVLHYGWDEVHEPAEQLEHAAPDELIDRIDAYLGHPSVDPHGDPIPSADGSVRYAEDAIPLSECADGNHTVVRISDANTDILRRLMDSGIAPGVTLHVQSTDEATRRAHINGEPQDIDLDESDTESIIVLHHQDVGSAASTQPDPATHGLHK